jgi:HAD superfamily hydrolase (TIGR01549 family)
MHGIDPYFFRERPVKPVSSSSDGDGYRVRRCDSVPFPLSVALSFLNLSPSSNSSLPSEGPFDWTPIRLVVFDVDGTLYRQRPLRIRMAAALIAYSLRSGSFRTLRVLQEYRRRREHFGDREIEAFEEHLAREVAERFEIAPEIVRSIVSEWIDARPLPMLLACRYAGIDGLFERIRASGRAIGILSDYSADTKLTALGLHADYVVSAQDVGFLKPHPRGLERIMAMAGESPDTTVLIGDRMERDGEAARRAGVQALLRTSRPIEGWRCFRTYDDTLFDGIDG